MSKKAPSVAALKTRLAKAGVKAPELSKLADFELVEYGMLLFLLTELSSKQAEASVRALRKAWGDWNEVRVSQIQELTPSIKSKSSETSKAAARLVKVYLQDIFQNNHGFGFDFLREDLAGGAKEIATWPVMGFPGAHYLQWIAGDGVAPVTAGLVRVFDRLGMLERTTSYKKGLDLLGKLGSPKGKPALEFAMVFGRVAESWCDSRKPLCHECPLVDVCPYGKKAYIDWVASQERLALQREREEEREQKRLEVEARRDAREKDRAEKLKQQKLKAARAEQARRKALSKAKRELEAKKKAAAKKAAKKVAKKAPAKKATKKVVKKAPAKKAAKKAPAKKAAKKAPAKKAAKKAAKKVVKKATKKVVKKAAKKTAKKKR